ncbi:unnamed protein product [Mytilus coruscus]|uniref:Uncharacterized protein n=1 Tax=Mytilus coruscus TaxID=42192 RepID=A0A6J8AKV6_MYTCO|nr:unnamed protein product [Mytilus coruscus]
MSDLEVQIEDNDKFEALNKILDLFVSKFNYVPSINDNALLCHEQDEMYNFFNNLTQWFIHIEVLNTTAKDGDITRGRSNNVESDLLQEHAVRNQKARIKQLGANKTLKAIESASAGAIAAINDNIAMSLEITPKSSRLTKTIFPGERQFVFDVLDDFKPFKLTPGRKFEGFGKLGENVFACIDGNKMKIDLDIIVNLLLSGHVGFGNDDNYSSMDSDDDDLPDL